MAFKALRVAVIGAGVSGLTSAKHLKAVGIEVVVFERSSTSGGIWSYDPRKPLDPMYPSVTPSVADFVVESDDENPTILDGEKEKLNGLTTSPEQTVLLHAPPGPAYDSLTNNISIHVQELKGYPWKDGLDENINVRIIGEYLQSFSKSFNVESIIKFNTRVEKIERLGKKWKVRSSTIQLDGPERGKKIREFEEFDAVVVANGHYHACKIPDIPGLKEWKAIWPSRLQHSKSYRTPDEFKDQNVLLIGAAVSSTDIAREIAPISGKVYQSGRGGNFDLPESFLPPKAERVAQVASFEIPSSSLSRGTVKLTDGRVLTDIDRVVIATGYHITLPFLRYLHNDSLSPAEADETILVTDGSQVHNLHKDIFYIPDPTLAFVGIPFYSATFTLFEFQAIAVAKVFSGQVSLPTEEEQRQEYLEKVKRKGLGRSFHSLREGDGERIYVRELVGWINSQVPEGERVEGHTKKFLEGFDARLEKIRLLYEGSGSIKEVLSDKVQTEKVDGDFMIEVVVSSHAI